MSKETEWLGRCERQHTDRAYSRMMRQMEESDMDNERLKQKLKEKTKEIDASPELLDCALGEWLSDCGQDNYAFWVRSLSYSYHANNYISDPTYSNHCMVSVERMKMVLDKAVAYYAKRLALTEIEEENAQAQNDAAEAAYLRSQE